MFQKFFKNIKKMKLHPVASYIVLTFLVVFISFILSLFNFQTTYNVVNTVNLTIEQVTVVVRNALNFDGIKEIISSATVNFMSFAPLNMFLISAIGLSVCESSGFLDSLFKKIFSKLNGQFVTFLVIFVATISTLINEIGFVILIPLAAIIYKAKGRNPMAGVCAAFAGVAFGTGTTLFVGSTEVVLIPYTTAAARLIDSTYHVSLLSNIFIMIVSSFILSIVGTIVVEKLIIPKLGKYRDKKVMEDVTSDIVIENIDDEESIEQEILGNKYRDKKGFRLASIVGTIVLILFIYSLIPNLPFSGLLLDMNEKTYLKQVFGDNSYFQDGFTYMISLLFLLTGLAYGIGSKKFTSDKDIVNSSISSLGHVGGIVLLIFFASQFIAIFKMTNIGVVLSAILANFLNSLSFGGLPFLIISFFIMVLSDFFLTGMQSKWIIFSPVVVSVLMKSNISPQFSQFLLRASDSLANGVTPLYAYFAIYLGYLNYYNQDKSKPITISRAIQLMMPYFIIITITWLLIILGWYIINLPIGPSVFPTI